MRIMIDYGEDGDSATVLFDKPDAEAFNEIFDEAAKLIAYAQFVLFVRFAESYGFDPYDDIGITYYRRMADELLAEMHEASKDLPPLRNIGENNENA